MKTIKVKISRYERETPELQEIFKNLGLQSFDSLHFQYHNIPEGVYHIDLDTVFSNQYDTTEGYRIFEKCTCLSTLNMKKLHGYYISEGIQDIREYQKDLKVCHYCGKQYYKSSKKYCDSCRDSKYLTEDYYHLLVLTNIHEKYADKDTILPTYVLDDIKEQQRINRLKRLEKRYTSTLNRLKKEKGYAIKEKDAFLWLINNDIDYDNTIYYSHTDTFCFGWNKALTNNKASILKDKLKDFPYKYEIKTV